MKNRVIVWRITQDCNMRCRFCSYSNDIKRMRDNADEDEIKRLSKILGEYKKKSNDDILVSWIGGEPFLWMNIIPYSKALFDMGISVSTTTNGLLLGDKKLREDIIKYFKEMVVSIDSFEECNDDIRCCRGHFKTVSENIRALYDERKALNSDMKIKVNTILMRSNIDDFEAFCEYLTEIGVDEVTFNQLGGYDRPEFFDANRLLYNQVRELFEKLGDMKKRFAKKGLIIHGSDKYLERIVMTTKNMKNSVSECHPAEWFWFINENGFISPCSYTSYEYKFDTKDIKSADDIDNVERYYRELRKTNRSKWCDNCFCTQVYDKFE